MVRRLPFGLGCDEAPGTAARGVRGLVSEKAIGRAQRWAARTLQSHHYKRTLLVFADSCAALALLAGYFTGALPYVVAAILLVAFVVTLPWLLLIAAALFFVLLVEFVFPFGVVAAVVWLAAGLEGTSLERPRISPERAGRARRVRRALEG